MTDPATGGCQCGRIRYEALIEGGDAYLCHCGMCRRATGGVSIAFCNVRRSDVAWTTREPDYFASSPIAVRGFCAACGTPLTFAYNDSEMMDLTIGSFDDPSPFMPREHFSIDTALPAWLDTSHLPGKRLVDNQATVDRWIKAVGKLPD